ncbi:MAG: hypothetical protein H5U03_04450 [Clostridia bacterium]|nr:hypothetical protein [Clostridia bacterium]
MGVRKRGPGVKDFRHREEHRKNNPPAGIAPIYEVRERQTTRYAYDAHLDLELAWAGKAKHTSFGVDVVSLHIHERISKRPSCIRLSTRNPFNLNSLVNPPACRPGGGVPQARGGPG